VKKWLCTGLLVLCSILSTTADTLDRIINIERSRGTVYELLNIVSERSQMLFIYEKGVVKNEKRARIAAGTYTLREAVMQITGEMDLQMRVIDKHILLYKKPLHTSANLYLITTDSLVSTTIIEGYVKERLTWEPIPYCFVALAGTGTGTVTNSDGKFALKIPDSLSDVYITISHIGYRSRKLAMAVFANNKPDIYLDPVSIQLQEVVVRYVPAQKIVREMLNNRSTNYSKKPAIFTSFYREGVTYGSHFVSITEGVCNIYKSGFGSLGEDQVKLLKMRNVYNPSYPDSILVKIHAGVRSSLILDVVQHTPDFLAPDRELYYNFSRVGMERTDSGMVHIVTFEQKPEIKEPLYSGTLYIDADNWALLKTEFELNPRFIQQAGSNFILKKSKNLDIEPKRIGYTISYQQWNGSYWINHVRGDLQFRIKRKKSLFWRSETLNTYFEMVTCDIDTSDVKRFPNRERLATGQIFSQIPFEYDAGFWELFNTIVPEEQLTKAITKLLLNVEKQM